MRVGVIAPALLVSGLRQREGAPLGRVTPNASSTAPRNPPRFLDADNTASDVWADSAYRSAEIEAKLGEKGLKSRIHRKGHRNKPLNEREKRGNETRSKVRARVEHVFGPQSNDMGGTLVRGIGLVRAKARIGLKNLAYNMRRLVQLERLAAAALSVDLLGG